MKGCSLCSSGKQAMAKWNWEPACQEEWEQTAELNFRVCFARGIRGHALGWLSLEDLEGWQKYSCRLRRENVAHPGVWKCESTSRDTKLACVVDITRGDG